ncbi:hypothetical protein [Nitrosopumilus ureiphilus]|uniref:Uncharacterized protein n=1 Tax=Nitrosopumilus ureiphilus TaxID=1470067 RepID=A0A7D5R781_9ARCH|nr:hypothetical protein [Nitrosopumilus ureiphilus]QLH06579.1 hypothetical protein C5F50_05480 [Nitrosopumilus ureiphilus]
MIIRILSALVLVVFLINLTSAFALSELERATMNDPRLENAFGQPVVDNVNVNQQIQISADITNNQVKSQNFVYIVQIKNEQGFVVSVGWISGQLTPDQKLNPSLSWTPKDSGEFIAEIFVWEGLVNHNALTEYSKLNINVS